MLPDMDRNSDKNADAGFVALLTAIQIPLTLYVRSLMPGYSEAKDVAQQANVKIWEKRDEFELGTNFKAWAFSIARFEVLNFRKRIARDSKLFFSAELEETMTSELLVADESVESMHEALRACLQKLKPSEKQLILHRYSTTSTLAEYANIVGRSVGGLKVSLHRVREKLLQCIDHTLAAEEARR